MNRLNSAISDNSPKKDILELLEKLMTEVAFHFETEARYMIRHNYPDRNSHIKEHVGLIEAAHLLRDRLIEHDEKIDVEFIRDWLLNHIMHSDKQLGEHLRSCGVR